MPRLGNYQAGATSALVKLALVDGPRASAPTRFESTVGAKVVGAGAPLALAGAWLPALARVAVPAVRAAWPAVRAAWPAVRDTGKYMLNQMRASPKFTTGLALGSAGLSALNGESPSQQVAAGLSAPVSWYGTGAAAGALGSRLTTGAGKIISGVPGASKLPAGIRNFGRAAGEFMGQNAGFAAMDAAGQPLKRTAPQTSWQVRPSNLPDGPMSRLDGYAPPPTPGEPGAQMAVAPPTQPPAIDVANGARRLAQQARRSGAFRGAVGTRPFKDEASAQRFMQRNPRFTNQYLKPLGWSYE